VEATKDEVSSFKMSKAELEDQLKIVHEEYTLAKSQMDERWALLQESRTSQEAVSNEYQRLKEIKDEKFKERNACRDELQAAPNQYYENRRFSQKVRCALLHCSDLIVDRKRMISSN
jgi:chromosome segregation ATPase